MKNNGATAQKTEQQEAIETLKELCKPGSKVYTVLRHVSRSGMMRAIDCYVIQDNEPRRITWSVAKACGMTYNRKHEALSVGGCGMDMGFHVVYNLSHTLYRDTSFECIGNDCPSNDHSNAYSHEKQGECMVCRKPIGTSNHTRQNRSQHHLYKVCSEQCAVGPWKHSDGGYALRHEWM